MSRSPRTSPQPAGCARRLHAKAGSRALNPPTPRWAPGAFLPPQVSPQRATCPPTAAHSWRKSVWKTPCPAQPQDREPILRSSPFAKATEHLNSRRLDCGTEGDFPGCLRLEPESQTCTAEIWRTQRSKGLSLRSPNFASRLRSGGADPSIPTGAAAEFQCKLFGRARATRAS